MEERIQAARHEYKVPPTFAVLWILTFLTMFQITKAGSDRLHAVLVALRQGAHGLLQRVHPYINLVDAGVFELTSAAVGGEEMDSWAETMDALGTAEQVLSKMLEVIGGTDPSPTKLGGGLEQTSFDSYGQGFDNTADSVLTEAPSLTTNVRVRSRRTKRDSEEQDIALPTGAFGFPRGNTTCPGRTVEPNPGLLCGALFADENSSVGTDDDSFASEGTGPAILANTISSPRVREI